MIHNRKYKGGVISDNIDIMRHRWWCSECGARSPWFFDTPKDAERGLDAHTVKEHTQ